jgi:hypothetical protein
VSIAASYERLVGACGLDGADAMRAIEWLMTRVVEGIEDATPSRG